MYGARLGLISGSNGQGDRRTNGFAVLLFTFDFCKTVKQVTCSFGVTELIAFPAGGIAAIVIATVVIVMVVAKVICVVTGYERRLPNVQLDDDDEQHKQIVDDQQHCQSTDGASHVAHVDCNNLTSTNPG